MGEPILGWTWAGIVVQTWGMEVLAQQIVWPAWAVPAICFVGGAVEPSLGASRSLKSIAPVVLGFPHCWRGFVQGSMIVVWIGEGFCPAGNTPPAALEAKVR